VLTSVFLFQGGHGVHKHACPLLRVKRTSLAEAQMSASDPKRTLSLVTEIWPTDSKDDLAASISPDLRCALGWPDTSDSRPDSNLEAGIAVWSRKIRRVLSQWAVRHNEGRRP